LIFEKPKNGKTAFFHTDHFVVVKSWRHLRLEPLTNGCDWWTMLFRARLRLMLPTCYAERPLSGTWQKRGLPGSLVMQPSVSTLNQKLPNGQGSPTGHPYPNTLESSKACPKRGKYVER
jgi:hypothetical protein